MISKSMAGPDIERADLVLRTVGSAFWSTLKRLALAAVGINLFWLGLFVFLGSMPLAVLSFFSALTYCLCYRLILLRKNRAVLAIFWVEVISHVILGTLLLGWESASHVFLFLCIPGVLASSVRDQAQWQVLAVIGLFFALEVTTTVLGPMAPLPLASTKLVAWLNYLIVFTIFCSLTTHYRSMVARAEAKLLETAMTGSLTGVSNRVHFHTRAATEVARARRENKPICLLLVDVDHFKQINDRYGHEVGDTVLKQVANVMQTGLREIDVLARWGGEEFLIMLPGSSMERSAEVAERLCDAIAALRFQAERETFSATISIGVAQLKDQQEMNVAVGRADKALYASKTGGRNRVTVDSKSTGSPRDGLS